MDEGLKIILEMIQHDIKDIKQEIRDLNAFKWKIVGMTALAGIIVSIILKLL